MKDTWKHVLFNSCLIYVLSYCTKAYLGLPVQANILDERFLDTSQPLFWMFPLK